MAGGNANVKVGVTGVAQFKQGINQAKQAVKTLDAQLALSEKQFKQNGDAESYMTEKAELLKAKLEQQKSALANAQKALEDMKTRGVDRTSKAYQDMYREMLKAKGEIIDTENAMNGLADAGEAAGDGVSEMNNQLKRVGDGVNFQQVTTGVSKITDGLEKAAQKAINLGKKIINTMVTAGSWADDLHTRATYYGLSDEELQRMEKTSTLIDTSVDAIISSQNKLKKGLGTADKEVLGSYAELLGEGYDPRKTGWEKAFWDAGEALMKFTNAEEQEVYAQRLFGRSWHELIPLFQAGREEYEKTNASWKVVSQESIDSLGKMDDEYQKLMADWDTFKYESLALFAEPMATAFETARDALGRFMEYMKSEDGQKMIDNIVSNLRGAIEWISKPENIEKAIDGLKKIVAGWALIKLTGGGLQVLSLINGAKNLFGGGKAAAAGGEAAATGAAVKGGALTGVSNAVTGASASFVSHMISSGLSNIVPVVGDMFMNQTNAGRSLRDGGGLAGMWEGLKQDLSEKGEEIKKNIETFEDDWKNNEIVKFFTDRSANADAASRLPTGADWRPSYMGGGSQIQEATEDLIGASEVQRKSSTEMTAAAGQLKGLPGVIENAILSGMSKITINIDGQQAGNILTPYVGGAMGGIVTRMTK